MPREFCVIDTETTGVGDADTPVEVAAIRFSDGAIFESFVNPGRPIPVEARAVHHIRDDDVTDAPTLDRLAPSLIEFVGDCVLVAHNARFDRRMLPFLSDRPWLCTMRLARHLIDDAFSYSNAALYELLCPKSPIAANTHRAAADARITACILPALLQLAEARWGRLAPGDLAARADGPYLVRYMPFGKHRGQPLDQLPKSYIRWLLREGADLEEDLRASLAAQLVAS